MGYISTANSNQEMWFCVKADLSVTYYVQLTFEQQFFIIFGHELNSIPNIRKKMKKAWELRQAKLLVDKLVQEN